MTAPSGAKPHEIAFAIVEETRKLVPCHSHIETRLSELTDLVGVEEARRLLQNAVNEGKPNRLQ